MEKEKKVVYLHEMSEPSIDEEQFYNDYQIPKKFEKYGYVFIPKKRLVSIEYICPHCSTHIKAAWKYISMITNRLIKPSDYIPGYSSQRYELLDYTPYGNDSYSIGPGRTGSRYSAAIYKDAQEYEKQLNKQISQNISKVKKEIKRIADRQNCPICNANLIKKFPYTDCYIYLEDKISKSIAWFEEYKKSLPNFSDSRISSARAAELEKALIAPHLEKYENFLRECDITLPPKTLKAEKDTNLLKEYLMTLINLETNIMCMSKRLKELYLLRGENSRAISYNQGIPLFNLEKEIENKKFALIELEQEKEDFENQPLSFNKIKYPKKPNQPKMLKANFFNKKKIAALNAQAEADYQEAMKKHLAAIELCKRQTEENKIEAENQRTAKIENYCERINQSKEDLSKAKSELKLRSKNASNFPTPAAGKKMVIDTEISSLEEALKKTFQCRNELYSYNVIFGKYRDIVAISTFYEYLMAGRCDSLEGANGAYNIYENEIRMDSIITKLDEIEIKLDEIKATQFMIYNALGSIESSLKTLNQSMEKAVSSLETIDSNTADMNKYLEKISDNTDVIAHNTAVTAYYSKVNAELTNALGFMVALK